MQQRGCIWQIKSSTSGSRKLGHPDFGTTGLFRRLAEPPAAQKNDAASCRLHHFFGTT